MILRLLKALQSFPRRPIHALVALGVLHVVGPNVGLAVAADTLIYSFENDAEGWTNNPSSLNTTVSRDTIGATDGTHSLKIVVGNNGTFEGALTNMLASAIGDPPGADHVTFDLTLTEEFAGTFANIGVFVFGQTNGATPVDAQAEFVGFVHADGLAAGTFPNQRIDLTSGFVASPLFVEGSFNSLIGNGPQEITPTGFQFYVNKSGGFPLTIYIDNIRIGTSVAGDYNGSGVVDAADYTIWRDTLGSNEDFRANGDDAGGSMGVIDQADYAFWKQHFGDGGTGVGGSQSVDGVPEPASFLLLILAGVCCCAIRIARIASVEELR